MITRTFLLSSRSAFIKLLLDMGKEVQSSMSFTLEPENERVIGDCGKEKQFPGEKDLGGRLVLGLVRCHLTVGSPEAQRVSMPSTQDGLKPILNACNLGIVGVTFPHSPLGQISFFCHIYLRY